MFFSFVVVPIIIVSLTLYFQNQKSNPPKIFGVYSQPGKWYHFKYIFMLAVLLARKFQAKLKRPPAVEKLEKLQHLSVHPKAFDAVFFQAVSKDGFYFCGGVERRHGAKINGLFYLVVPNLGLLESTNLPKTLLDADPESVLYQKEFSGGGLTFAPVEPMKKWRLKFEGQMNPGMSPSNLGSCLSHGSIFEENRGVYASWWLVSQPKTMIAIQGGKKEYRRRDLIAKMVLNHLPGAQTGYRSPKNPDHLVTVKLDGIWHSTLPYFDIASDSDSSLMAQAIAREEWSKEYFKALKESHQTHYEQMGYFKGSLAVENDSYDLHMDAMRDHSFGFKRDWSLLHRYIFHMFYLEDDTRASIGVISHPCTSSHLELGYVVTTEKIVHAIQSCDLLLYQQAEDRRPPWDYGFSFKAGDRFYEAQVKILYEDVHYKGNDTEALLFERFFECEVNGLKGRGISEWHYNNTK